MGGAPPLFCYTQQFPLLLTREPEGLLQAGAKTSEWVSVIPKTYEADFLRVEFSHSQNEEYASFLETSDKCGSPETQKQ